MLMAVFVCLGVISKGALSVSAEDYIKPYPENRFYWQLKGEPVLLLGGTVEDNVYQIPGLEAHLDSLASVGGNYVRCTMSCRDAGDVWWFEKDADTGLYDLNKPGEEHWTRFENFMKLTSERGIVAQFEIWDRFDFARENWPVNPYNPKMNRVWQKNTSNTPDAKRTRFSGPCRLWRTMKQCLPISSSRWTEC
jgi:hypothetical protein